MFCRECGKELPEGTIFCTNCGTNQTAPDTAVPPAAAAPASAAPEPTDMPAPEYDKKGRVLPNPLRAPAGLTRKAFFRDYSKAKANVTSAAIIGYVAAGVTLVFSFVTSNPFMLLDVVILLAMSLLLHLIQSRVCAILLLAYSLFNTIYTLVTTGQFTGWLVIIAGVVAVTGAFAFHKEWREYQRRCA